MTVTVERPADLVVDYRGIGLRLWADKVQPHGRLHDCLVCADTRASFALTPLAIVIGRHVIPSLPVERRS